VTAPTEFVPDQRLELPSAEAVHREQKVPGSLPGSVPYPGVVAEVREDHGRRVPGPGPVRGFERVHATWNSRRVG
jgi:hypothetical protein